VGGGRQASLGHHEERIRQPSPDAYGGRRHRRGFAFAAYVPHPIADWEPLLSGAQAHILAEADRAVGELNRDAPSLAGLEALARQLLRQESVASSRIEGLVVGQRRLAHAAGGVERDQTAREVLGNIRAMQRAVALATEPRGFTLGDLLDIHRTLLQGGRDERFGGVVREQQNWIGGQGFSPAGAAFVPPPPEHVGALLEDLVAFVNRADLPAALQAAAAHAQFETIHPFVDGNGRAGRCLVHVVLRRRAVADHVVPPISPVLATNADGYIRSLEAWRGPDPLEWCLFFAGTTLTAVRQARSLSGRVEDLRARWLDQVGTPRRDAAVRRLIEQLPAEPIVTVKRAQELTGTSRPAAAAAVGQLWDAGVLQLLGDRRRDRQWEAREVFDLLDRFERDLALSERGGDARYTTAFRPPST